MGGEHPLDAFRLDDRSRGVPPGQGAFSSTDISTHGWSRADGLMALPLLSVDLSALDANRSAMMEITHHFGVGIAPHAKTPMAPALARAIVDAGAWGTSVTDLRQASVMLRAGLAALLDALPATILTAGGSSLFDLVIELGLPVVQADGRAILLLRCGSLFFGDHGNTKARLDALVARGRLDGALDGSRNPFQPAVRLWAELLSCPQDGLAVCGLGLRDTSHDQGMPVPLRLWRHGQPTIGLDEGTVMAKLNDQHAFVTLAAGLDARVGDVLEFVVRNPCTCLDKHDVLCGLDDQGTVTAASRTFFG